METVPALHFSRSPPSAPPPPLSALLCGFSPALPAKRGEGKAVSFLVNRAGQLCKAQTRGDVLAVSTLAGQQVLFYTKSVLSIIEARTA